MYTYLHTYVVHMYVHTYRYVFVVQDDMISRKIDEFVQCTRQPQYLLVIGGAHIIRPVK